MLSIVLATHNEESNLKGCLESVKALADETVIVDGSSTDKTAEIGRKFGAKVKVVPNQKMFHINKQKALELAQGDWILHLDADERVSPELASEIKKIISMSQDEIEKYQENLKEKELFLRHQQIILNSKFKILNEIKNLKLKNENSGNFVAFYLPRKNYFLGKYLRYGGVYPDGVIRLVKKGKAHFPCKDVHELMEVNGRIGWLANPILHYDSPTFKRYLERNSRYISLMVSEMENGKVKKNFMNFMNYVLYKPLSWFFSTTLLHKGILDGWQGIVFSLFSALRFPRAYLKYLSS